MKQYKIETVYIIKGGRTYYQDGKDADDAIQKFNDTLPRKGKVSDKLYLIKEEVKDVDSVPENERIDVDALNKAKQEAWEAKMNSSISDSLGKLKEEMGFGVPDEIVKS